MSEPRTKAGRDLLARIAAIEHVRAPSEASTSYPEPGQQCPVCEQVMPVAPSEFNTSLEAALAEATKERDTLANANRAMVAEVVAAQSLALAAEDRAVRLAAVLTQIERVTTAVLTQTTGQDWDRSVNLTLHGTVVLVRQSASNALLAEVPPQRQSSEVS